MTKLQRTRDAFNEYVQGFNVSEYGVEPQELDALGFEAFAAKIQEDSIRKKFCQLAFDMMEANVLEHMKYIPELTELRTAGSVRSLREWREVLVTWESTLHALQRASDA